MKKLFLLSGCSTEELLSVNNENSINFISRKSLNKFVDLVEIVDPQEGFSLGDLPDLFRSHITHNNEPLDIIISMHGLVIDGEYKLLSKLDQMSNCSHSDVNNNTNQDGHSIEHLSKADELIKELICATNGKKLNILIISCYGKEFIKYIDKLPVGSKVMTISDVDAPTEVSDFENTNANLMIKSICQKGFKLEHIFELYCINQKFMINTPSMSFVKEDEVVTLDFELLQKMYNESEKGYSPFILEMFDENIFDKSKFDFVKNKLADMPIKYMLPPSNFALIILKHINENALAELMSNTEEKYYFKGVLGEIGLGLPMYFKRLKMIAEAEAKINCKRNDILNELSEDIKSLHIKDISRLEESIGLWNNANNTDYFNLDPDQKKQSPLTFGSIIHEDYEFIINNSSSLMPQHSIAMGLLVDFFLNNNSEL